MLQLIIAAIFLLVSLSIVAMLVGLTWPLKFVAVVGAWLMYRSMRSYNTGSTLLELFEKTLILSIPMGLAISLPLTQALFTTILLFALPLPLAQRGWVNRARLLNLFSVGWSIGVGWSFWYEYASLVHGLLTLAVLWLVIQYMHLVQTHLPASSLLSEVTNFLQQQGSFSAIQHVGASLSPSFRVTMANPILTAGRYGCGYRSITTETRVSTGWDGQGKALLVSLPCRQLTISLHPKKPKDVQHLMVTTEEWVDGKPLCFYRNEQLPEKAWYCRIGKWKLPGMWLLKHRIFNEGSGVVLLPFDPVTSPSLQTAALGFAVVLPRSQDIIYGPGRLVVDVHHASECSIGLLEWNQHYAEGAFLSNAGYLPSLCPAPDDYLFKTWLQCSAKGSIYRVKTYQLEGVELVTMPSWRQINHPPQASIEGDFLYVSPSEESAAWYIAGYTEEGSEQAVKRHGALIVGGPATIGLKDILSTMMWSSDARYLAFLCQQNQTYQLLVLDSLAFANVSKDAAFRLPSQLYRIGAGWSAPPTFLSFDEDGLRLMIHDTERHIPVHQILDAQDSVLSYFQIEPFDIWNQGHALIGRSELPLGPLAHWEHRSSQTPIKIGVELAERITDYLACKRHIGQAHRDYCGIGLMQLDDGSFVYSQLYDGHPPTPTEARWNQLNDHREECRWFENRSDWVAWLAQQDDASLYCDASTPLGLIGNQRLTVPQLKVYIMQTEN